MPNIQFQVRRGTASTWTSTNPTLANGEFGFETDTRQLKIGNNVAWNVLPYLNIGQAANWSAFPAYQTVDMSVNILNNVGSIRNGAGTVSAPSYTFMNDVSMGLFSPLDFISRETQLPDFTSWNGVASSADGTRLVAVGNTNFIYTSTNFGVTWAPQSGSGSRNWAAVASSADGIRLVAVVFNGFIYTSTNSGVTWDERSGNGSQSWRAVASSEDGTRLIAAANLIYISTNSGVTWSPQNDLGTGFWGAVASSRDGTRLVAAGDNFIYTSTNSGATWTQQNNSGSDSWQAVASSADGTRLIAASGSGLVRTSTDSGATWTTRTGAGSLLWSGVASSADGTRLVAVGSTGFIRTSADSGVTWATQTAAGSRFWSSVASSADGTRLVAGVGNNGGLIYTLSIQPLGIGIVTTGVERGRFDRTGDFGIATTAPRSGVLLNAQNTSIPAVDVSGQLYARLPVYIQNTTSVNLNTNYNAFLNSYFFITNSGFNAITLPTATPTTQGGAFFQFKNSTSSFLSITLTNTLGLTSPVVISPSNAITFVVSPSNANTMLLF